MKSVSIKNNTYINFDKQINNKDPELKVGDYLRISEYKKFFTKGYTPNWSEEAFVIKKIKNNVPWTYIISDLNDEEIIGTFYVKELRKTNQKEFRREKEINRKANKLYVKWKGYDNSFNNWINKKLYKMSKYFPKPYNPFGGNVKVELDLSNYTTKTDLIGTTGSNTSNLALKSNLAKLKTKVYKINVDKLKAVLVDLNKLSDIVNNEVVKNTVYDKLAAKVNNIDTSGFV